MASPNIIFIECPFGDSFAVRKTSDRSCGIQQIVCPDCGKSFELMLEESVERLSGAEAQESDTRSYYQGLKPVFFQI